MGADGKPDKKPHLNFNFDFLQKLGKVLMTVIAVMPAAGLMISLGKLVQMAGADMSVLMTVGSTMENIGWAVINNLHILFAVAIGGSWAKERAGGAFAAIIALYLISQITGSIFGVKPRPCSVIQEAVTHTLFGQGNPGKWIFYLCAWRSGSRIWVCLRESFPVLPEV
ncbi:MAG: PTS transporter subunit EIIC [Clostridium sp.]